MKRHPGVGNNGMQVALLGTLLAVDFLLKHRGRSLGVRFLTVTALAVGVWLAVSAYRHFSKNAED